MTGDFRSHPATEQDYLEDNIAAVAFHLGRPGARLSVQHDIGGLVVDPGEVLKEVSRRLSAPDTREAVKWRHKKRGSIVTEVARGFAQVAHHPIEEMTCVVIYRHDEDGRWWVRNAVEFDDGRFEEWPSQSSTGTPQPRQDYPKYPPDDPRSDTL